MHCFFNHTSLVWARILVLCGLIGTISPSAATAAVDASSVTQLPTPSKIALALLRNPNQQHRLATKLNSLDELLSTITIYFPDQQVSQSGLYLRLTQFKCKDLSMKDFQLEHNSHPWDSTKQLISVDVSGVGLTCTFRYGWSYQTYVPFTNVPLTNLRGSGSGKANIEPTSSFSIDADLYSEDFMEHPPNDVDLKNCNTKLGLGFSIKDDGVAILDIIVSLFDGLLMGIVEDELEALICNGLEKLDEEGKELDDMLDNFAGMIEQFHDDSQTAASQLVEEKNPTDPTWINFEALQDATQERFELDFNELVESILSLSSSSGGADKLIINAFLNRTVLDEDGLLIIPPSSITKDGKPMFSLPLAPFFQIDAFIKQISVRGLNSFTEMNVLEPIGNYTLQNSFKLDYLTLKVELETLIEPFWQNGYFVKETFAIEFGVNDVDVNFAIFLGITLDKLRLGSVIHTKNILNCILGTLDKAEISSLSISVKDIVPPTMYGFTEDSIDDIFTTGAKAFFAMYEPGLSKAMPNFLEKSFLDAFRGSVNSIIEKALNDVDACPEPDETLDGLVDFRDLLLPEDDSTELLGQGKSRYGDLFRILYGFLDDFVTYVNKDGASGLSAIVTEFAGIQAGDGDIIFDGELVRQSLPINFNGLEAFIDLGVSDVRMSNLTSIGELQVLKPMFGESSTLNNVVLVGIDPNAVGMEARFLIKGNINEVELRNQFKLGISMKHLGVALEVLAEAEEPLFLNFALQDITNINCWMAMIVTPMLDMYGIRLGQKDEGLVLRKLAVTVAEARLTIECIECSSPMMHELAEALRSQEGVNDTTQAINMLFSYLSNLLGGDFLQSEIDKRLAEAPYHCPHSPSYQQNYPRYEKWELVVENEDSYDFLIAIIVVIGVVSVLAAAIFFVTKWILIRRHNHWITTLSKIQQAELAKMQHDEQNKERDRNQRMSSLFTSKEVPWVVRLLIPLAIIGNVALFLSGHLSLGASVIISGSFAGTEFAVDDFFEFSIANTTMELWKFGAKELALLMFLFSMVWPYTKLLITFFLWFAKPSWRCSSSKRRGKVLHWLDVLGKWSMFDVFALIVVLAAIRIQVESPDYLSFVPEGLYSFNMVVVLKWGLYANLLAQLISQIISHVVIHYHRKTVKAATKSQAIEWNLELPSDTENREKLCLHKYKLDYEASNKHAVVRKGVDWLLLGSLLSFAVIVIIGCSLPAFNVEILGLVGIAVESGQEFEQAKKGYSVFDLASTLIDQARFIDQASAYIGMGVLASILVITVFIVPLAQAASLTVQWFAPMTKRQLSRNMVFNEVLSAWQYMEVYVLAIIITAWQMGGLSESMLDTYCESLQGAFANLVYYGILAKEDAQCFRVNATVESASWLLVSASLMLWIMNHFISAASKQKRQDDITPANERLHTDRWDNAKPSQSPAATERVNMAGDEGAAVATVDDSKKVKVSPIPPRFTDYYSFATTQRVQEVQASSGSDNE